MASALSRASLFAIVESSISCRGCNLCVDLLRVDIRSTMYYGSSNSSITRFSPSASVALGRLVRCVLQRNNPEHHDSMKKQETCAAAKGSHLDLERTIVSTMSNCPCMYNNNKQHVHASTCYMFQVRCTAVPTLSDGDGRRWGVGSSCRSTVISFERVSSEWL